MIGGQVALEFGQTVGFLTSPIEQGLLINQIPDPEIAFLQRFRVVSDFHDRIFEGREPESRF
jgi:hypothetical protein